MSFSAFGPYPYPSEIILTFLDILFSSANLVKSETGSEPGDSTKIKGVTSVESLKHLDKSNVGTMMNSSPIITLIQF